MTAAVTLATIARGDAGELRVTLEPHPRTGESIVVLGHVRADGSGGPRAPLRPRELDQVISALKLAAQTLDATKARPRHRTVSAERSRAEIERDLEVDRAIF